MNKFRNWLRKLIEWATYEPNEFEFEKVSYEEWKKHQPSWMSATEWKTKYHGIKMPKRATEDSAGYDIAAPYRIVLPTGKVELVPTGLKASMGKRQAMLAFPKSGLGFKFFIRLANTIGVIDADYYNNIKNEGHIMIKIRNENEGYQADMIVEEGDGFCQVVVIDYHVTVKDEAKGKREGGFGSTSV